MTPANPALKDHPALKHELAARAFIVRTLQRLGLRRRGNRTSRSPRSAGRVGGCDMTTKRRPIHRDAARRITPAAVDAFRKMESARRRCTCPPIDWEGKYGERPEECSACKRWLGTTLDPLARTALQTVGMAGLPAPRRDECPYPAGCYAAERWHKERRSSETARALELYEALLAASKASLTPEGPARHGAFKTRRTSPPLV